jgi:hypothetical protein
MTLNPSIEQLMLTLRVFAVICMIAPIFGVFLHILVSLDKPQEKDAIAAHIGGAFFFFCFALFLYMMVTP